MRTFLTPSQLASLAAAEVALAAVGLTIAQARALGDAHDHTTSAAECAAGDGEAYGEAYLDAYLGEAPNSAYDYFVDQLRDVRELLEADTAD